MQKKPRVGPTARVAQFDINLASGGYLTEKQFLDQTVPKHGNKGKIN
jgi:hypothetical protein